ncbi:hypothetical protein LIER_41396 [Lithospermum erythrorhizon]|uniref:Uncharacterized protein n=1 Tax=Lithospermum erythrorhizon TaxID=34254 RepID=A0AAV3RCM6_LITER
MVECECCGLKEECTQGYIRKVEGEFDGKRLCGLCLEVVRDEVKKGKKQFVEVGEAITAHMSFCGKHRNNNPATLLADGLRQLLRRRC